MIEGLFVLTTIFVAYVVYAIIGDQRASAKSKALAAKPETPVAAVEQPKPPVAVAQEKPAAVKPAAQAKIAATKPAAAKKATPPSAAAKSAATKPAEAKPAAPKAAAKPTATKATTAKPAATKQTPAAAAPSTGLKDPKTGEVATAYHNYRFAKRWIKDALVEEGLLDKVYPAKELNPEVDAKIKEAIAKLEAMDKYKA
jgi:outer membrane biosynthesis protein TonB